jgi:acetyl esterase
MRTRHPRPDPEVRRLLLQMAVVPPPKATRSVESVRREWQLAVKAFASREPVATVDDRQVAGQGGPIQLRIYTPHGADRPGPALVWFHGGGFVLGDIYTAGATCRALAHHSGVTVIAVRYRLAPEHPLQAGVEDCLTALQWVAGHAAELGVNENLLAVGGDSAGGGLAALAAQRAARTGLQLAAQVLVYPATELAGCYPSATERMPGLLDHAWMEWIRAKIREVSDPSDAALSAIRTPDLSGLAPAIVLTAGFDPLRDEGLHYAQRLREHGVPVRLLHFPGQIHGFLTLDRVLAGGRYGLRRLGAELALAFTEGVEPGVEDDLPGASVPDRVLWRGSRQRWHELRVAAILVRERAGRLGATRQASTLQTTETKDRARS